MAKAVLEREGFAVVRDQPSQITVRLDDEMWTASANGTCASGHTFKALAAHVRALPQERHEETES